MLIFSIYLAQPVVSQDKDQYNLKWGVNADYSFSGSTNTLVIGPAIFWEKGKERESGFWHVITAEAGFSWSKHIQTTPVTSVGYYFGNIPGFVFGISSQQYYKTETNYNNLRTDVRLSGEVILALFGFLGYRYQYPLVNKNEAQRITRHAFFLRIPVPVKTISKK